MKSKKKKKKKRKIFSFLIPRVSLFVIGFDGRTDCCFVLVLRSSPRGLSQHYYLIFCLCADFSRVSEHFKSQSKGGKKLRKTEQNVTLAAKPIDRKSFVDANNNNPKHLWKKKERRLIKTNRKKNFCERVGNRLESCRFFCLFVFLIFHFVRPRVRPDCSIMKNHSGGLLGEKLPFYQKVLNMTLGISQSSASTRKAEEPLAPSPFRRGYTRAAAAAASASAVGRPGIPVTPIHVVTTTPGHPAHMGTGGGTTTTPVTPSTPTKHGSTSTAASIFRSFRRRSLRRSFRRTKSFLVKTPTPATPTPTPTITSIATGINDYAIQRLAGQPLPPLSYS